MRNIKASVIAIGTEVTSGQIQNRNAHWISNELKKWGFEVVLHQSVPDERQIIQDTFKFASERSELIFITGGLGPTSDDFTRESVAQFLGLELVWDDTSWSMIQERLSSRGMPVREIQKQQCYFPRGAEILTNSQGTANGFLAESKGLKFIALPGPPREIEAIWREHIEPKLKELSKELDPLVTVAWDTLGLGESEVARAVLSVTANCPLEIAYRVHLPYVEVKLSYLKSQQDIAAQFIKSLDEQLSYITVGRNGEDPAQKLCKQLSDYKQIVIKDSVSGAFLFNRLNPHIKPLIAEQKLTLGPSCNMENQEQLSLALDWIAPREARASLSYRGQRRLCDLTSPYQTLNMLDREKQYLAELAIIFWQKELSAFL